LCQQYNEVAACHYLEAFPARRRLLVHQECLAPLLKNTGAETFLAEQGLLLIQPGVAHSGVAGSLRLRSVSWQQELLNTECVEPAAVADWEPLLRAAAGRRLVELYGEHLLLTPALPFAELAADDWYQRFRTFRQHLQQACREEKI
jgi:hypothetical protein